MPAEDAPNDAPPSPLRRTPNDTAPASRCVVFPGSKRTDLMVCPAVPSTPNAHVAPPSVDRYTPPPCVASTITDGLAGLTAMSVARWTGQAAVCTADQVTPASGDW